MDLTWSSGMIREYNCIEHFGILSFFFFIFLFFYAHTTRTRIFRVAGSSNFGRGLGTRCSADETTKRPLKLAQRNFATSCYREVPVGRAGRAIGPNKVPPG